MSFYAYKGFDKDLKCRGFQYEIGKTYKMDDYPVLCKKGFHYCTRFEDVFPYYPILVPDPRWTNSSIFEGFEIIKSTNRYCIVEVLGEIDCSDLKIYSNYFESKGVTNEIRIVKELDDMEINYILANDQMALDVILDKLKFEKGKI